MNTLREAVAGYLALRRGLGFTLRNAGIGLGDFVSFLEQQGAAFITTTLAVAWAQQPASARPAEWARRLSYVRASHATAVPPTHGRRFRLGAAPTPPGTGTPLSLYRHRDSAIAGSRPASRPGRGLRPWTYHALLGLLAVTGLRISEALGLTLEDVDLRTGVLTVHGTKFGKSRLVPLHASTQQVLTAYTVRRGAVLAGRHAIAFFVSRRGTRLDGATVRRTFYTLSRQIGCVAQAPAMDHAYMISAIALRSRRWCSGIALVQRSGLACRSCPPTWGMCRCVIPIGISPPAQN